MYSWGALHRRSNPKPPPAKRRGTNRRLPATERPKPLVEYAHIQRIAERNKQAREFREHQHRPTKPHKENTATQHRCVCFNCQTYRTLTRTAR